MLHLNGFYKASKFYINQLSIRVSMMASQDAGIIFPSNFNGAFLDGDVVHNY